MLENFQESLKLVLKHEGGYVDHPRDPGGATNMGVTQGTYKAWLKKVGRPARHVKYITSKEVSSIYKDEYWDAVRADDLPAGLDYAVFDGAVNSGPNRSIKWMQKCLGVTADGISGPQTRQALLRLTSVDVVNVINAMLDLRMSFLQNLRHWSSFGRGWTNRVQGVRTSALYMSALPNGEIKARMKSRKKSLFTIIVDLLQAIIKGF